MEFIYRGTFLEDDKKKLKSLLVQCDRVDENSSNIGVYFISNKSNNFDKYQRYLRKLKLSAPNDCVVKYENNELENIKYWTIRSTWRNGYPSHEDDYLDQHFGKKDTDMCDCHLDVQESVTIKKIPNYKNKHFFQLFWLESILFCDINVKELLVENNVSGIEFLNVCSGKQNLKIVEDTFQIKVLSKTIHKNILKENEFKYVDLCEYCDSTFVFPSCDRLIRYDIDDFDIKEDVFYSNDKFNKQSIIVSTKVKELIEENQLQKGLEFRPVFLRDDLNKVDNVLQIDFHTLAVESHKRFMKEKDIASEYRLRIDKYSRYSFDWYLENVVK